jgi:hypothetical protein
MLGALFGVLFFAFYVYGSKHIFAEVISKQQQCTRNHYQMIVSLPIDQQDFSQYPDYCFPKSDQILLDYLQANLFGPSILLALIFPPTWKFIQPQGLYLSSILFAIIGGYCVTYFPVRKGLIMFLSIFFSLSFSIALFTYILGVVSGAGVY